MLKSDVAWWRFCKDHRVHGPFRDRSRSGGHGFAAGDIAQIERELWRDVHGACAADEKKRFLLGAGDLPDPENVGRAYDAVMSRGLPNDRMRRPYLREDIARSGRKETTTRTRGPGLRRSSRTTRRGHSLSHQRPAGGNDEAAGFARG